MRRLSSETYMRHSVVSREVIWQQAHIWHSEKSYMVSAYIRVAGYTGSSSSSFLVDIWRCYMRSSAWRGRHGEWQWQVMAGKSIWRVQKQAVSPDERREPALYIASRRQSIRGRSMLCPALPSPPGRQAWMVISRGKAGAGRQEERHSVLPEEETSSRKERVA